MSRVAVLREIPLWQRSTASFHADITVEPEHVGVLRERQSFDAAWQRGVLELASPLRKDKSLTFTLVSRIRFSTDPPSLLSFVVARPIDAMELRVVFRDEIPDRVRFRSWDVAEVIRDDTILAIDPVNREARSGTIPQPVRTLTYALLWE